MTRGEIRYLLFTLLSEAEGKEDIPPVPNGFRESFEQQSKFRGFVNFGVTWDVDEDDPWTIIALKHSHLEVWNDTLVKVIPVITEEGIVSADEYNTQEKSKKRTRPKLKTVKKKKAVKKKARKKRAKK